MNIDLALDTLSNLPFENVLASIKKIKDENKRLVKKNNKLLLRFDECIQLLSSHYKLNKELRELGNNKTKLINSIREENGSLSIIIDDLTKINKDLEKENAILWSEKKTECTDETSECECCCGDQEECDCDCDCSCHQETIYKDLAEKEEKIKVFLTQIEKLKKENKELKKKQVFVFKAPKSP